MNILQWDEIFRVLLIGLFSGITVLIGVGVVWILTQPYKQQLDAIEEQLMALLDKLSDG